jgi:hypothetical protein
VALKCWRHQGHVYIRVHAEAPEAEDTCLRLSVKASTGKHLSRTSSCICFGRWDRLSPLQRHVTCANATELCSVGIMIEGRRLCASQVTIEGQSMWHSKGLTAATLQDNSSKEVRLDVQEAL